MVQDRYSNQRFWLPQYSLGHPILVKSWEGFVIEKVISALPSNIHPYFYRTAAGAEIDLLLEFSLDEYWAIEIKASRMPTVKKGFHMACEDLKVRRKFVVYTGEDTFPLGNETTVLPLAQLIESIVNNIGSS